MNHLDIILANKLKDADVFHLETGPKEQRKEIISLILKQPFKTLVCANVHSSILAVSFIAEHNNHELIKQYSEIYIESLNISTNDSVKVVATHLENQLFDEPIVKTIDSFKQTKEYQQQKLNLINLKIIRQKLIQNTSQITKNNDCSCFLCHYNSEAININKIQKNSHNS